jgi:transcriptional regulator NrdR family protein
MAMRQCTICGSDALVTESRREPEGQVMRRYRCVANHSHRFVTHEVIREEIPSTEEAERISAALAEALALIQKRKARLPIAA